MGFSEIIDGIVGIFSPKAAASRAAWRIAKREYDAASGGAANRNWRVSTGPAEITNSWSRYTLRARARDLEQNSDITNAVIAAKERNILGGGFVLQARTPDESVNSYIEDCWRTWCKARNCDVTGTQSLNQMLKMAIRRKTVDGGILFVKRYTPEGKWRFSLQMVEVDELDNGQLAPKHKGNKVVGGIEYNKYNRPVGYYITQYDIDGFTLLAPQYVDANDVIFYFTKTRPSQVREISDMAPMMTRIRDANEFIVAVSVKQRIEACLSVFIKRVMPQLNQMGRDGRAEGKDKQTYDGVKLAPGLISELDAGDEIQVVNPTGQSADATSFLKMFQKLISSGFGMSYESVSRDLSETNYSSARQGAIEDEVTFAEEREQITAILDEIYETFIISMYLSGYLEAKDFNEVKEKYFAHEWIQRPKKWIDPLKEANASKTALQCGLKTYQQLAAENGMDWHDQLNQIIEVAKYGKDSGVDLAGLIYGAEVNAPGEGETVKNEKTEITEQSDANV